MLQYLTVECSLQRWWSDLINGRGGGDEAMARYSAQDKYRANHLSVDSEELNCVFTEEGIRPRMSSKNVVHVLRERNVNFVHNK